MLESHLANITVTQDASSEPTARHAGVIRDIVQGEREEMAKQLHDACAANEALERQVIAERARADECKERVQELEDELARVRAELEHGKQQRISNEELRREDDARRDGERGDELKQQLSENTDILLAHREEFSRKQEVIEEHWERKQEWREEDGRRWDEMYRLVQGIIDDRAEERERCEEERRAAAEKPCKCTARAVYRKGSHPSPATQDIINTLTRENQSLRELFERSTDCECSALEVRAWGLNDTQRGENKRRGSRRNC